MISNITTQMIGLFQMNSYSEIIWSSVKTEKNIDNFLYSEPLQIESSLEIAYAFILRKSSNLWRIPIQKKMQGIT